MKSNPNNPMGLSTGQENLMVLTLALVFGFVMFDRFALANMSSFVMADLQIDAAGLGMISSAFALSWAVCGYFGGMLADMTRGKKRMLVICVLLFSVLSLSSGFAGGFVSLALIRFMMGIVEGPVLPLNQSILVNESTPTRRGLNQGLMQVSAVGLFSSLLGPILCAWMATTFGWRGAFYVTIIPGLIIAVMLIFLVKEPVIRGRNVVEGVIPQDNAAEIGKDSAIEVEAATKPTIKEAFLIVKNRNVLIAVVACIFILFYYLNVLTFAQPYLVAYLGQDAQIAALPISCLGIGAVFWGAVLPRISDIIGRRPALVIGCVLATVTIFGLIFLHDNLVVFCICCFIGWAGASVSGMFQGTVPSESVDPAYATTTLGLVQAIGELVGGSVGGIVAGLIINSMGYDVGFWIMMVSIIIVIPLALGLKETAPAIVAKKAAKAAA